MLLQLACLTHELWSQVLELGIAMYLLADQLGWVSIVPLLVVLCRFFIGAPGKDPG